MGRVPRLRRALSDNTEDGMDADDKAPTTRVAPGLVFNECVAGRCGPEAACSRIPNDKRYTCICPHDKSPPTRDLRCPIRRTVPLTPRPIYNIIPPSGVNSTTSPSINITAPLHTESRTTEERQAALPDSLFIGFCVATSIVIAVVFTVCLWKRKEIHKFISKSGKHRKPSCTPCPLNLSKGLLVADRYTSNPQYTPCLSSNSSAIPVPLLPRETLCFLQEIGEGCFGKVYKGELQRDDGQPPDVVAVKVLKETATREAEEDFMREVDIMSAFRHANILSLIGVVLKDTGSSPWMVFEFMPYGDLAEVLRRNSRQLWKPVPGLAPLTKESLLSVALQISAGMRYLAAQRFVHRDLACRNCLVGVDLSVKIADFGMSRDVYTCDYYKIGGSRLLPVRWMSPESVTYGRFTLESDVWSYGVVLWEIYSLGKQPYYGHSNEEVVKLILQGIMLIPPEDCPPIICDLMRSCWKTEPRDRMRFPDVHERLQKAWDRNNQAPTRRQSGGVAQHTTLTSYPHTSPAPLPRPPGAFPIAQFRSVELLDTENYLLPQIPPASRCEYLQPLPD